VNEGQAVSLIALVAWLILAGSALASYRLNWNKALKMALTWVAIFGGLFLLFDVVRGG
jgi:hypothetical protein